MKNIKTAIAIFIAIPVLIFFNRLYLNIDTQKLERSVSHVETLARSGDMKRAKKEIKLSIASWNKDKRFFGTFIRHSELDLLNQSFSKLPSYLDSHSDEFYTECDLVKMQILHIARTETISLENIL